MPDLKALNAEYEKKVGEHKTFLEKYIDAKTGAMKDITPEVITEYRSREDELAKIQKQYNDARAADEEYQKGIEAMKSAHALTDQAIKDLMAPANRLPFAAHPKGGPDEPGTDYKTLGEMFIDSKEYQARKDTQDGFSKDSIKMNPLGFDVRHIKTSRVFGMPPEIKALFQTSAGFAPFVPRNQNIVFSAQRKPVVADLIPQTDVAVPGIRYMEETTFTNNAAAVAEGGTKPEAVLAYTERLTGVSKVAVNLPVTEETLMDVPIIRDVINNRLGLMILLEEDRELLNGSGTAPEITGFLNKTGVQTLAQGGLDAFSALLKGIVQVENTVGFADVTGMVMHPLDWFNIRTIKDSLGQFIMGKPDQQGPETLWGKPIIRTIACPQGTILEGDFTTFSQILRREGITFRIGYVNDQFIKNEITVVVEERFQLVIYRPSAFITVTGAFTS